MLVLCTVMGGCAAFEQQLPEAGYRLLSRDEIRMALAGKTLHGTFYGTYESRDQWSKWHEASDCDRIYRRGDDIVCVNRDGSKSAIVVIEQGNTRGL